MKILGIEPYYGGSHRTFLDGLTQHVEADWSTLTLPARGWKWRLRTAAPHFAKQYRDSLSAAPDLVFASSMLSLGEFLAMAGLSETPSVLYFHENQFEYPVRREDERDLQLAMTNVLSAHVADSVMFNSDYNRSTFMLGARDLVRRSPDASLGWMVDDIEARSSVVPVPIDLMKLGASWDPRPDDGPPIICWNHRWEHDKNPEGFFACLHQLKSEGVPFRVAILGQPFKDMRDVFDAGAKKLGPDIVIQFGPIQDREEYLSFLSRCSIVVSTSHHEFQGLSVMEAVARGAYPVLPDRLAYPELFPSSALYSTPSALIDRLRCLLTLCPDPDKELVAHASSFSWEHRATAFQKALYRVGKKCR